MAGEGLLGGQGEAGRRLADAVVAKRGAQGWEISEREVVGQVELGAGLARAGGEARRRERKLGLC